MRASGNNIGPIVVIVLLVAGFAWGFSRRLMRRHRGARLKTPSTGARRNAGVPVLGPPMRVNDVRTLVIVPRNVRGKFDASLPPGRVTVEATDLKDIDLRVRDGRASLRVDRGHPVVRYGPDVRLLN